MAPKKGKEDAVAIAAWNRIVPGQGALIHKYIKEMMADAIDAAKLQFIAETYPPAPPDNLPEPDPLATVVHSLATALRSMGPDIRPHDQALLSAVRTWFNMNDSYRVEGGLHKYDYVARIEEKPEPEETPKEDGPVMHDLGTIDKPEDTICIVLVLEQPDEFITGDSWEHLARELEQHGDIHSCAFMAPRRVILT